MASILPAIIHRTPLVTCLAGADVTTAVHVLHLILLPTIYPFVEPHSLPAAAAGGAGGFLVSFDDVSRQRDQSGVFRNNHNDDDDDEDSRWSSQSNAPGFATSAIIDRQRAVRNSAADAINEDANVNVTRVIDRLISNYDKRLRPNYKGDPVKVSVTMFVSSVSSISEVNMDFTLDFYFRQYWHDPRLDFSDTGEDELCITNEMLDRIWWPDTFFANAKSAHFHLTTTKNAFLRISPTGLISQSLRLTVTATCRMDLTYFPMDTQVCSLEIESYAYSVKHIIYGWKRAGNNSQPVGLANDVQLPQVKVKGYRVRERVEALSTGNYSRLACEFYFARSLGYYIIQIYIPSSLIVVLSWVSFWLHRDAAPARVALGITTVLTMTTLISSTNASLPKISYLKSIDVYLVACFVMVFASIVEFAAVSYIGNLRPKRKTRVAIPPQLSQALSSSTLSKLKTESGQFQPQLTSGHQVRHVVVKQNNGDRATSRPEALVIDNAGVVFESADPPTAVSTRSCGNLCGSHVDKDAGHSSMRKLYTECDLHHLSRPAISTVVVEKSDSSAGTSHHRTTVIGVDHGMSSDQTTSGVSRVPAVMLPTSSLTNGPVMAASDTPLASCRRRSVTNIAQRFQTDYGTWSTVLVEGDHVTVDGANKMSVWSRLGLQRLRGWLHWPPEDTISVAEAIDQYARLAFPVAFLILSSIYWTVYLQIRPTFQHDPEVVEVE